MNPSHGNLFKAGMKISGEGKGKDIPSKAKKGTMTIASGKKIKGSKKAKQAVEQLRVRARTMWGQQRWKDVDRKRGIEGLAQRIFRNRPQTSRRTAESIARQIRYAGRRAGRFGTPLAVGVGVLGAALYHRRKNRRGMRKTIHNPYNRAKNVLGMNDIRKGIKRYMGMPEEAYKYFRNTRKWSSKWNVPKDAWKHGMKGFRYNLRRIDMGDPSMRRRLMAALEPYRRSYRARRPGSKLPLPKSSRTGDIRKGVRDAFRLHLRTEQIKRGIARKAKVKEAWQRFRWARARAQYSRKSSRTGDIRKVGARYPFREWAKTVAGKAARAKAQARAFYRAKMSGGVKNVLAQPERAMRLLREPEKWRRAGRWARARKVPLAAGIGVGGAVAAHDVYTKRKRRKK